MALLLYDEAPRNHDAYTQAGNFARVTGRVRTGEKVVVPVTLTTFHRLPRLLHFAAAMQGKALPPMPTFEAATAPGLTEGIHQYVRDLRPMLHGANVDIGGFHPRLVEVFKGFDQRATPATRPNLLRLLGVVSDTVFIGPHTFHLDISNTCNTNCTFCGLHSPLLIEPKQPMLGRRFTDGWKGKKRDWEEFTDLVDDLHDIGCREDILFNGEGEPLAHPRALDMVKYVCAKDMNLTLFTNGLAVKGKAIDVMVENEMHMLYWSLHAATKETFHRMQPIRRPEDFPKMVENVRDLAQRKRKRNNKPHIVMAMVINADNYHECEKFMDLALYVGADSVRYQIMHACSSTESLLMTKEQFEIARAGVEAGKRKAAREGMNVVANIDFQLEQSEKTYDLDEDVLSCFWSHDLYNKTGCIVGWFFSRAFTDGKVSFCCHDKIVDNLRRVRFKELWFSDRYQKARMAGKAFDLAYNINMVEGGCGSMLLGDDCSWCGNYEFMNKGFNDLTDLGWREDLRRVPPG